MQLLCAQPRSKTQRNPKFEFPVRFSRIGAWSACYRGPKAQTCPKWSGEGAKGVLTGWRDGLPGVSCTSATLFCTSATLSCTSATGFWSTYAKTPFAPPLLTTLGAFEVSDPCSRPSRSQFKEFKGVAGESRGPLKGTPEQSTGISVELKGNQEDSTSAAVKLRRRGSCT